MVENMGTYGIAFPSEVRWVEFRANPRCEAFDGAIGKQKERDYPTLRQGLRDPKIKNRRR